MQDRIRPERMRYPMSRQDDELAKCDGIVNKAEEQFGVSLLELSYELLEGVMEEANLSEI
jgi:hypothetical protein